MITWRGLALLALPLLLICTLIAGSDPRGTEYFVSPRGDDTHPGTSQAPFRTIQKAADIMVPGDICTVKGGVYRETVSPSAAARLIFRAAPGEEVFLVGTEPLEDWGPAGPPFRAAVSEPVEQLFWDGRLMAVARWPNAALDPFQPSWASAGRGSKPGRIVDVFSPKTPLVGARVKILPGSGWVAWTRKVNARDTRQKLVHMIDFDAVPFLRKNYTIAQGTPYYLFGSAELLDQPGEWAHDAVSSTLFFWPPGGVSPKGRRVEVKRRELGFDLRGKSEVRVQGFRFFACTADLSDSVDCVLEDCHFRYPSEVWDCEGFRPSRSRPTGVALGGTGNLMTGCSVELSAGNGITLSGSNNTVSNCLIRKVAYAAIDGGAVYASGVGHRIMNNTLAESGRSLIPHYRLRNGRIERNRLSSPGLLTKDNGATYTWGNDGQGTVIAFNWVHSNRSLHGCGIYLDNGSSGYIVKHNVVWDNESAGIRLNTPSLDNLVVNNTTFRNGRGVDYFSVDGNIDMQGTRLINNLFQDNARTGKGAVYTTNVLTAACDLVDPSNFDFRPLPNSTCADGGTRVEGLSDSTSIGAYGPETRWVPGHDWGEPPSFERLWAAGGDDL